MNIKIVRIVGRFCGDMMDMDILLNMLGRFIRNGE